MKAMLPIAGDHGCAPINLRRICEGGVGEILLICRGEQGQIDSGGTYPAEDLDVDVIQAQFSERRC